mgnify:CR=1 FL=1
MTSRMQRLYSCNKYYESAVAAFDGSAGGAPACAALSCRAARAPVAVATRVLVCKPAEAAVGLRAAGDHPRLEPAPAILGLLSGQPAVLVRTVCLVRMRQLLCEERMLRATRDGPRRQREISPLAVIRHRWRSRVSVFFAARAAGAATADRAGGRAPHSHPPSRNGHSLAARRLTSYPLS